jgi:hypothetical protein
LETSLVGKERKELSKDYFDSATSPAGELGKDLSKQGSHHRNEQQQKELRAGSSEGEHKLKEEATKRSRDRLVNETASGALGGDNCWWDQWGKIIPQGTCWICDSKKNVKTRNSGTLSGWMMGLAPPTAAVVKKSRKEQVSNLNANETIIGKRRIATGVRKIS